MQKKPTTSPEQSATAPAPPYSYLTVKMFTEKHKAFSVGGLRFQIFNEETNGLKESGAVIRNGSRVLINEPKYFDWLEEKNRRGRANG